MKYTLKHPLTLGKHTITHLTLREHTIASDYLAFDQEGAVARMIALIASVSDTDPILVGRLHEDDYFPVKALVEKRLNQAEPEPEPAGEETPESKK